MGNPLFEHLDLGPGLTLKNRIVMAPLTRCMADNALVPTDAMAAYYARRADAGLIVSEAILVSQEGQGYPNSPGLFTEAQITGWQQVTDAVHQRGGKIFAQLWHTGRVSHSIYHTGRLPLAPSAQGLTGHVSRTDALEYEVPQALTFTDIKRIQGQFVMAARNALTAGFDGIEVHGANGYLIDQFLHWDSNHRDDQYGGSTENMARFVLEILSEIRKTLPQIQMGLRLSPQAYVNMSHDDRDKTVFDYLIPCLNNHKLVYIHTGMFDDAFITHLQGTVTQYIRRLYRGTVIASGGYDQYRGKAAVINGDADLIAIGRAFIANPDYVEKVQLQKPLREYDEAMLETLY